VRCKRNYFLYHGTLLYNFPLDLVAVCLRAAPRQPAYRRERGHDQFVTNAPVDRESFIRALTNQWDVVGDRRDWPRERVDQLVRERYGRDDWNFKR
jgi:lipoate-protein ligase A